MSLDIANSNVNRNITLAGTSVAIFTFLLFFLYPRNSSGEVSSILFRDHSCLESSARAGNDYFWKGRSLLARRLQPTVARAKLDSVYCEPISCRAVCISSLVLLPVPHLAPV